jgi:hypothetical protein
MTHKLTPQPVLKVETPGPGRGRGRHARRRPGRRGRRRAAAHLRAAAVLRGVPARPGLHRAARHHRPDLRDLPGRLPDERVPGDRGRLRRDRRRDPGPAPAALLRRVDREPRAARLPAARPGLPRLRRRHRDGRRPPRPGRARAAAEEGRQRPDDVVGGRAGAPGQRPVGGFYRLPPRRAAALRPRSRAREDASPPCAGSPASSSPSSSRTTTFVALRTPDGYPLDGNLVSSAGLDIPWRTSARTSPRSTSRTPTRCTRPRRAAVPGRPAGPVRAERGACRPWRGGGAEAGLGAGAATRSAASSCAPSSWCTPATRRSRSSTPTRAPAPGVEVPPRAGVGHGATEAPRGLLYHRYELDDDGTDPRRR